MSEQRFTVAAAVGDGAIGAQTGTAIPLYTTGIFMWETATGVAATTEAHIARPDIIQVTQDTNLAIRVIVRQATPGMGVRRQQHFRQMPARTFVPLGQITQAAIDPAQARLPRYRPIPETVRALGRVRSRTRSRVRSRARGPRRSPANDHPLSRRVPTHSLDPREVAHRVLVGTRAWGPEGAVEARVVSNSARCKFL